MTTLQRTIELSGPYDLEFSLQYFVRYGFDGLNRVDGRVWRRAKMLHIGLPVLYTVVADAGLESPTLELEVRLDDAAPSRPQSRLQAHWGEAALDEVLAEVRWVLSLDLDMEPFFSFAAGDPWLGPLIAQNRAYRPIRFGSIFEGLVHAISAQQVNLPFAFRMRERLIRRYGTAFEVNGEVHYAFPTPDALVDVDPAEMRKMQFSRQKTAYIREAARAAIEGKLDAETFARLSDDDVIARLTSIKGIGRWTAEWLLIRCMGRPDSFPADDAGVRRAMRKVCFDGRKDVTSDAIRAFAERWMPHRSLATQFVLLEQ